MTLELVSRRLLPARVCRRSSKRVNTAEDPLLYANDATLPGLSVTEAGRLLGKGTQLTVHYLEGVQVPLAQLTTLRFVNGPPMWATGTGADVHKAHRGSSSRGVFSAMILTLFVIPPIYVMWRWRKGNEKLIYGCISATHAC